MKFTPDEQMVVMLYSPGTRLGLIAELTAMKRQLTPGEKKLKALSEHVIKKLTMISDDEFEQLDFFPEDVD